MHVPDVPPRDLRDACRIPAYANTLAQLSHRISERDISDDLAQSGVDRDTAARVIRESREILHSLKMAPGNLLIAKGAIVFVIGAGITLTTIASAAETGGGMVICYGAIIAGIYWIMNGISKRRYPNLSLVRDELDAALEAANEKPETGAQPSASASQYDY